MDNRSGRAFIVRPFGEKSNAAGDAPINFDAVDTNLIAEALRKVGLTGGTTGEFVQQGNIRSDMFRELLVADLVIADISIHNANAFYELGIRHALRDQYTVMIRAARRSDPHVFDLKVERYLSYDPDDPAASIEPLVKAIRETLKEEKTDSPVFQLVPGLTAINPDTVVVVPNAFRERVELAAKNRETLLKLKDEAIGQHWETGGLRVVGRALFDLGDHEASARVWETVRSFLKLDVEANQKLATSYQKLGEHALSEQAASRALETGNLSDWSRAETHALMASNYKTQWQAAFETESELVKRQCAALTSPFLEKVIVHYLKGFETHRSHYYSGLNAVAALAMQIELAKLHPGHWELQFEDERRAAWELEERTFQLEKLIAATDLAIESSVRNYPDDVWARISRADLKLISARNPQKVKLKYEQCAKYGGHNAQALKRQLKIYQDLALFAENVEAALEFAGALEDPDTTP